MQYLLDTNVLSESSKPNPDGQVMAWLTDLDQLVISGVTLLEIRYGLLLNKSNYKEQWFKLLYPALTVLAAWNDLFPSAVELLEQSKAKGQSPSPADMLIAAYAKRYALVLATRNTKDFAHCGIDIVNPWQ